MDVPVKEDPVWRQRFRAALVKEPILISLALRWFGWFVALVIYLMRAAPPVNLQNAPIVLALTLVQLLIMSAYPKYLRQYFPKNRSKPVLAIWPTVDALLAILAIYLTGGWDSPFYHFGVTTVLAPALRFGLVGALISSTLFSICFMLVVKMTAEGFSPAYLADGQAEPDIVSSPLNPLMIGLYAAFLGEVLKRLNREMKRSKHLAAEAERARMARDIHDGVSQTLFMLAMSLETGQVLAEKEKAEKTAAHLQNLTPVAQKALLELRNAMYSVQPLAEGGQSLGEAVTQLARDYKSATGQNIICEVEPEFDCSPEQASELFPMIQEALANACQHSGASTITLTLHRRSLEIKDDGTGFDPEAVSAGRGLGNLGNRAEEARIHYCLKSDESGTRITFSWDEE